MGRLMPATGSQISMGRIWNALNLSAGSYPPSAGSNISLNATLGLNRGNNKSGVPGGISAGGLTRTSQDFGGLLGNNYYPYYVYDAYLQTCVGGIGGTCGDTGGILSLWIIGDDVDTQLTNGARYSEPADTVIYRIASARTLIYTDTLPVGTVSLGTPTLRAAGDCCF
jgi:hypothetical protein